MVEYTHPTKTQIYKLWRNIYNRCYNKKWQEKYNKKYIGHTMSDEVLNNRYETFYPFVKENMYQIEGETVDLDHDILKHGNTVYELEYMIFAPHSINVMYEQLEVGKTNITYNRKNNTYTVKVFDDGEFITAKDLQTYKEALDTYCNLKYMIILEKAEQYKDKIPEKLYNAMINTDVKAINQKYYDNVA